MMKNKKILINLKSRLNKASLFVFFIKYKYSLSICFIWIILFFLLFYKLGSPDIQFWDEATNANIVVETSLSDLPNLIYNQDLFFEKPPLFYYIGILSYQTTKMLGQNIDPLLILRLISAVCTFFTILSIFYVVKNKISKLSWLLLMAGFPAFWLVNSAGFLSSHNFRTADSDAMQIMFIVFSFCVVYIKFFSLSARSILIGVFSGLAFMTKGPIGLIGLIAFYNLVKKNKSLCFRDRKTVKLFSLVLISFIFVILPWHLYMHIQHGQNFWSNYIGYHQLSRISSQIEGHTQPFYFYFAILLDPKFAGTFIFSILLLFFGIKVKLTRVNLYILISLFIFIAFSIVQTKISWYILPAIIFLGWGFVKYLESSPAKLRSPYFYSFFLLNLITSIFILIAINLQPQSINLSNSYTCYYTNLENHRVFKYLENYKKLNRCDSLSFHNQLILVDNNEINYKKIYTMKPDIINYKVTFLTGNFYTISYNSLK